MARFKYLLDLTPLETWRVVRRRLPFLGSATPWTAGELLSSTKHRRGIRFAELLMRQEAILQRAVGWNPLTFEGTRTLEIGCGPLAGFGPIALFCGADSFESAEPEWDPELFFGPQIGEQYLLVLHADLVALYGPRMSYSRFRKLLTERMIIHRVGFQDAPIAKGVDVILSQSVLEHVFPLAATLDKLAAICSPHTRSMHLVDFGNHYPTEDPFAGLYEQPRDSYIARRGKAINLARSSDLVALFQERGIAARLVPTRVVPELYRGTLHPWWRGRYDDAALFTNHALVSADGR